MCLFVKLTRLYLNTIHFDRSYLENVYFRNISEWNIKWAKKKISTESNTIIIIIIVFDVYAQIKCKTVIVFTIKWIPIQKQKEQRK